MAEEKKEGPKLKGQREQKLEDEAASVEQVVVYDPDGRKTTVAASDLADTLKIEGWTTDRSERARPGARHRSSGATSDGVGKVQSIDTHVAVSTEEPGGRPGASTDDGRNVGGIRSPRLG